ncbi:hypothetical protein L208DRAFT_1414398 [Tricholoma matsutake]|nr:hypothetical protein L208DRAFT_1414398 [Tricholoma matsutake 945]
MPNDADFDEFTQFQSQHPTGEFDPGLQRFSQVRSASSSLIEVHNCGIKDHGGRTTSC